MADGQVFLIGSLNRVGIHIHTQFKKKRLKPLEQYLRPGQLPTLQPFPTSLVDSAVARHDFRSGIQTVSAKGFFQSNPLGFVKIQNGVV